MKKRLIIFFLAFLFALPFFTASIVSAREIRTSRTVTLQPPAGEVKNFYLVYGDTVNIDGIVNGDVYAAAREVNVRGKINGDLLALGESVSVAGDVTQNVRVLAGNILITGHIGKNLTVATRLLEVLPPAIIEGGIASLTSTVDLESPVGGQIKLGTKEAMLTSRIGSDTEVWAENLSLSDTAEIKGDLTYYSAKNAEISKSASISGQIVRSTMPLRKESEKSSWGRQIPGKIAGFLGALLVGYLLIRLFPKYPKEVADTINQKPAKSIIFGFLALILIPLALIVIMITVIGIPLSLISFVLFLLAIYMSKIFVSYWLGDRLLKGDQKFKKLILGLLSIYILTIIPFAGKLLSFFILIVGLGSQLITLRALASKKHLVR